MTPSSMQVSYRWRGSCASMSGGQREADASRHHTNATAEHEETCYYNESATIPRMQAMDPDALLALVLRALRTLCEESQVLNLHRSHSFPPQKYAKMALLGVTSPDKLANIPHVLMAACTWICAYQLFDVLPLIKPLTSRIPGFARKGHNGITVDPPKRLSALQSPSSNPSLLQ